MSDGKLDIKGKFRAISVYRRIEEDLRTKVKDGHWLIGTMLPSRRNLAKEYGVDERTIQRAIAGLLADGTLRADSGRGTFVTAFAGVKKPAPELAAASAIKTLALVLDQFSNQAYPSTQANLRGIYRAFHTRAIDCRFMTFPSHGDTIEEVIEREHRTLNVIETEGIAGAIIYHVGGSSTLPQIARMLENGVPMVFIDRCPGDLVCDFVGVTNSDGAREAVEYLLKLGHRRIAFLTTTEEISTVQERMSGYVAALRSAGIAPQPELIWKLERLKTDVPDAVDYFMAMAEPPTALFAVSDHVAHLFIAEAEKRGWSIPDDISVIGFDDIDQFMPRQPFLTTIQQPFELIGLRAADLLLRKMAGAQDGRRMFQQILLPTKLVVRSSCRPL